MDPATVGDGAALNDVRDREVECSAPRRGRHRSLEWIGRVQVQETRPERRGQVDASIDLEPVSVCPRLRLGIVDVQNTDNAEMPHVVTIELAERRPGHVDDEGAVTGVTVRERTDAVVVVTGDDQT